LQYNNNSMKNNWHITLFMKINSETVVSLRSDRGTTYEMYIAVQNELVAAYNELRDQLALQKWNVKFEDLPDDKQEAITTIYPMKISEAEPNQ